MKILPLLIALVSAAIATAAEPIQVTIEGARQGKILGDGPDKSIVALGYQHELTVPRDAATGAATGRRMHKPLTFVKAIDRATPQILSALTTNEKLSITLKMSKPGAGGGKEAEYFTITLTDAYVSSVRNWKPNTRDLSADRAGDLEEVTIYYRMITWSHADGTSATDDWYTPGG